MKQTIKALIALLIFAIAIIAVPLLLQQGSSRPETISIVTTNFPSYDFARAVVKDVKGIDLKMLIAPGAELHNYEPTPGDIKAIEESSLFIYTGGESDAWVDNILKNLHPARTKIIKMMDEVTLVEEETVAGMESEDEEEEESYDEHIWTSPKNAIRIITQIKDAIVALDPAHQATYVENADAYISALTSLDDDFAKLVESAKRKELIFGDRFPFRYFVEDYGLTYYAAFPGCSDQTEASAKTIAFLIDRVKSDNIPVVFHIELSSGKIAEEIAAETSAKVLTLHSAHNISKEDFENGITYLDLLKQNLAALKEALN